MVTHSSTSRPVQCLCMAERTGCPVFTDLWSYVVVVHYNNICSLAIVYGSVISTQLAMVLECGLLSRQSLFAGYLYRSTHENAMHDEFPDRNHTDFQA
jgi:hypothetical protein